MPLYYDQTSLPSISEVWGENEAPLNQTRKETREEIRRIVDYPVSMEALSMITTAMNTAAELSPEAVAHAENQILQYRQTYHDRNEILEGGEGGRPFDGPAPLKKADVVEYDTSLLAEGGSWVAIQTQGLNARMMEIQQEIMKTLNLKPWGMSAGIYGQARLYRS